ncbi:hypothetical protein MJG53_014499 [Ovis ammon polii x Ovis aries]|uniref:Uncharacterized protein n=1 Tax=Ovis ammon polii x Ovis aries TaxID=2918886 RepID=A0ACB9UHB5_9CETA|nr:hypothetical protein MJG53_014499 [Ovis ammon polii x Ovis aries]
MGRTRIFIEAGNKYLLVVNEMYCVGFGCLKYSPRDAIKSTHLLAASENIISAVINRFTPLPPFAGVSGSLRFPRPQACGISAPPPEI